VSGVLKYERAFDAHIIIVTRNVNKSSPNRRELRLRNRVSDIRPISSGYFPRLNHE